MEQDNVKWFSETFDEIVNNVGRALLGKKDVIRLVVTAMLAEGHVLLEDAPGTGKTALARALAASVLGSHSRIQFTPDLLPSDITGVTIYDQKKGEWEFHRGPIFASVVLADEINRASPKTQSALLEVMEESRVTVDGIAHQTGRPFMVLATQNPIEQAGTYKLPEAQLDRFLLKTSVGYPDREALVDVLEGSAQPDKSRDLDAVVSTSTIVEMVDVASTVHIDRAILGYVSELIERTRNDEETVLGVSTRGAISMARTLRVWAASKGRDYAIADDVKELAQVVWAHRIVLDPDAQYSGVKPEAVIERALMEVETPQERAS